MELASTPMGISPAVVERLLNNLADIDQTFKNKFEQSLKNAKLDLK